MVEILLLMSAIAIGDPWIPDHSEKKILNSFQPLKSSNFLDLNKNLFFGTFELVYIAE